MSEIIRLEPGQNLAVDALHKVAAAAKSCKIVGFPTDTVYGIGSTGLIKAASRRIYQIKARSSTKPLPILVHSAKEAQRWVVWTKTAELLAKRFWPGSMTLVLKTSAEGRLLTFAEYATLAIRVPAHPVALSLLEASGVPWAVTSANISGKPAINDANELIEQMDGSLDYIIAAGPTPGIESTVVDAGAESVRILRTGKIPADEVFEAAGQAAPAP